MKDDEDKDNNEGFENFAEEDEDFKDKGNPVFLEVFSTSLLLMQSFMAASIRHFYVLSYMSSFGEKD